MENTSIPENSFVKITLPAIVACFLWSTAFVGVKVCLTYTGPLFLAGVRFMLAGLVLLPFCGSPLSYVRGVKRHWKTILLVSLFQTVALYSLFNIGLTMVPGAIGAVIIGASPITTAIVTHFLVKGDRLTPGKTLKILLGVGGIVLVAVSRNPLSGTGEGRELPGMLLLLLATVASALGNILVSRGKKEISPLVLNSSQIFLGGLILFLLSLLAGEKILKPLDSAFFLPLIYLSCMSAVAFSIWFLLLKKPGVKVSDLNVWKFIIPVFGAINAWILLPDESPQRMSIVGMLIVGLSVVLVYLPKRRPFSGN